MPSAVLDIVWELVPLNWGTVMETVESSSWYQNILVAWETPQRDKVSPLHLIECGMSTLLRHKNREILLRENEVSPRRWHRALSLSFGDSRGTGQVTIQENKTIPARLYCGIQICNRPPHLALCLALEVLFLPEGLYQSSMPPKNQ